MKTFLLTGAAFAAAISTSAMAADLPTKAPAYTPAAVAPAYDWSGFYIGGHVGWGWADHHSDAYLDSGAFVISTSSIRSGVVGGAQAGYNWMVSPSILLGFEVDVSASGIKDTLTTTTATGTSQSVGKNDLFGTVRGRAGYAFNNWLLYGTGGFAWMDDTVDRTVLASVLPALVGQTSSRSSTLTGWTAGGGVEVGFLPNWTAKVEYLHMDFGSYSYHFDYVPTSGNRLSNQTLTADVVTVGLNYRFGR